MVEKVVYVLGAGFSAPLGIPTMARFLERSKDMYVEMRPNYGHFKEVFDLIKKMSVIKNYYSADLFNIEEIFSILEMQAQLEGANLPEKFRQYIVDVVRYYSPTFDEPPKYLYGENFDSIFGGSELGNIYGVFVAHIHSWEFCSKRSGATLVDSSMARVANPKVQYGVVTLNYDCVLENICTAVSERIGKSELGFRVVDPGNGESLWGVPALAKLHGSVDSGEIVPPTWSKGISDKVLSAWKLAYRLLAEATHIRFLGYSLPQADSYVKYLLKSALLESDHLKSIDIICLDPGRDVEERYRALMTYPRVGFCNSDILDYLTFKARDRAPLFSEHLPFDWLENSHAEFVEEYGRW